MSDFNILKAAVDRQFEAMAILGLFQTDVDKDILWETYLGSFPEGTNPIFRERREHDCQCCKQFIRACGNVVSIVDNKLVSIWDVEIGGHYQVVADALSKLVKSAAIKDIFLHYQKNLGTDFNHQSLENGAILKWSHFYFELPEKFVKSKVDIGGILSDKRSGKEVFQRGLTEISVDAIETVLELIEQNSLYRGKESEAIIKLFLMQKTTFDFVSEEEIDNYCWTTSIDAGAGISRIRDSAIGTLLVDLSNEVELNKAVASFESKVAPANYKHPTALITKSMISNAQKKIVDLGIEDSLQRRYAVIDDITVNNVIFADRTAKKAMNVFDELAEQISVNISKLKKVEEVPIETFIKFILPKADSIELMFENSHANNLMSLIAPENKDAPPIFKWGNNFSWAYNGEVADSIKERVKRAGGNVTGDLRCSLSWFNFDDLDIHVQEPSGGSHIYYRNKRSRTGGTLDVDMNDDGPNSRNAVENTTWPNKAKMLEGIYKVWVNQFRQRENIDIGFDVEIEFAGVIHTFHYGKRVTRNVRVATFEYSHKDGIKFLESLPSTQISKEVWNIPTQQFHRVSMIMHSPNHWDGHKTGNKHWFFILEGCKNSDKTRGFFNEFLKHELNEHRKVFEVLGSKMKTEKSDIQLSGLGFSSTQKNHVFCKITGSFSRIVKIIF